MGDNRTGQRALSASQDIDLETCDNCGEDKPPAWVYDTGFTYCAGCLEERLTKDDACRAVLDDLYAVLAGRTIQLKEAGEEKAAERWNGYCIKVREALDA